MQTNNKMREALESISSILKGFDFDNQNAPTPDDLNCVHNAIGIADAALAEPPRNCDVGTAEEQSRRFDEFCFDHRTYERGCGDCPLVSDSCCELAWAQQPYTEGADK